MTSSSARCVAGASVSLGQLVQIDITHKLHFATNERTELISTFDAYECPDARRVILHRGGSSVVDFCTSTLLSVNVYHLVGYVEALSAAMDASSLGKGATSLCFRHDSREYSSRVLAAPCAV